MKRLLAVLIALSLIAVAGASAETNSRPDDNDHPYVGQFVGDFNPSQPGLEAGCSGTLISPTVFLTAAHCIDGRPNRQSAQIYVTFDTDWSNPAGPTDLHPVSSFAWNPLFDKSGFSSKYDIAVLVLRSPVIGIAPARLPTQGLLDAMAAHGGLTGQTFDSVGYGALGVDFGPPVIDWQSTWQRNETTSGFSGLTPDLLVLLTEDAVGYGGGCYGDSGAPHLVAGTNIVVGVESWIDQVCEALNANPRVDTPSARAFLGQFVSLP